MLSQASNSNMHPLRNIITQLHPNPLLQPKHHSPSTILPHRNSPLLHNKATILLPLRPPLLKYNNTTNNPRSTSPTEARTNNPAPHPSVHRRNRTYLSMTSPRNIARAFQQPKKRKHR